jgi:hypothetical protein
MPRALLLFIVGISMLVGGCMSYPKDLSIEYRPGQKTKTFEAPYEATYVLVAIDERQGSVEIQRTAIEERYQLGFVREPDGVLVAYAGGMKTPLAEGRYLWRITPETKLSKSQLAQRAARRGFEGVGNVLFWYLSNVDPSEVIADQANRNAGEKRHTDSSSSTTTVSNSTEERKYREEKARPENGESTNSGGALPANSSTTETGSTRKVEN